MAPVDHYEFGRIVVDGRVETRDLIILPDRVVRNWWRQEGHVLVVDDLGEVIAELPSHLLLGTGADGRMRPDPETIRHLQERGVTVEALPTGQAVRRFGGSTRPPPQPLFTSPADPGLDRKRGSHRWAQLPRPGRRRSRPRTRC
jgi:hypothetical protein